MEPRKAAVVGAGIAGLATAIALHRRGWTVTVLERAPELREVGAGISLWPNSLRALDQLGVGDQVRAVGTMESAAGFRHRSGRWLLRTDVAAIERHYGHSILIRRRELLDILSAAAPFDGLQLGAEVTGTTRLDVRTGRAMVRTSSGQVEADLVVGADGIRSTVRRQLWPAAKAPVYAGYTTWRFITPPLGIEPEVSESWGRGERVGLLPFPDTSLYSYLSASVPAGREYPDDRAELLKRFGHWHDPIPAMIDSVEPAAILRHDIYRLPPLASFVAPRTALVGDAAHAMTPDFGQGGGTALEDAVELAEALDASKEDLDAGLRQYDDRRRPRTQRIARQSAIFGMVAQWSSPPAAAIRDLTLRLTPSAVLIRSLQPMLSWRQD